jgi:hypothetical protein
MPPKLKEIPREWLKFTSVMAVLGGAIAVVLHRRGILGDMVLAVVLGTLLVTIGVAAVRPRWFRGFYRAGMTVSFHIGHLMGHILLTVIFVVLVIPLGLLLRVTGKDLLQLKRPRSETYWHPARNSNQFERQF